jgi:uncharacterized protein (TIGR02145 family)
MKKSIVLLVCFLFVFAIISSCKKEPVIPTLTTSDVTNITINSGTSGGVITKDGGAGITAMGVCWSATSDPSLSDSFTSDNIGTGAFTSLLTGLIPNTLYHVRAYATNKVGTAYGNDVTFTTTPIVIATLTTAAVTSITLTTAVSGGIITSDGNGAITARGVCWATVTGPTITNDKTTDSTGVGTFVSNLPSLLPATTYYVRAYATNSAGTAYGNEQTFITGSIGVATLTTTTATLVTLTTATTGGNITSDGGAAVTARGVCWAITHNPITTNSKTSDNTGTGIFVSNLTGLNPGTVYYVRAYATNSAGTSYGNEQTFTTGSIVLTILSTTAVTSITTTTAVSGGTITSNGGGAISASGVCWSTAQNPAITDTKTTGTTGTGAFVSNLTSLLPGTIYHVRAYATNSAGTAYGSDIAFTTLPTAVPTVTTTAITSIDLTTAVSGGNITPAGAGTLSASGVCWSTSTGPVVGGSHTSDGTLTGIYTSTLTSLLPGTKYYVRAYATNSVGTGYGAELTFNTKIADGEGNKYATVTLGAQVWMAENLKTKHYNNGDTINTAIGDITTTLNNSYQWPEGGNEANVATFGRLYNFKAVTNSRGVCPTGFRVPSYAEWTTLSNYLSTNGYAFSVGGTDIAKSMASTSDWTSDPTQGDIGNNQASNNSSGFNTLPGGFRDRFGVYQEIGGSEYFGSSTKTSTGPNTAWYMALEFNYSYMGSNDFGSFNGYAIRCVK